MNKKAYEIHSLEGLELLNGQLVKLSIRTSKIFYEHDFIHDIWRGFLKHPIIFSKLYKGSLLNIAGRILDKRNSSSELECAFEPGMQYAWRDDTV